MCLSLETPLCPLLQLFFFIFLLGPPPPPLLITPSYLCHLFCSLRASVLLTVASTCHQTRRLNCHAHEPGAHTRWRRARVSTRPRSCNQERANWSARTVKIICMGLWQRWSGSLLHSNTLRICKAALPISGTLLRAVELWRGKTSSHIHWLSTITHPSTCCPGSAQGCHVRDAQR